MIVGPEPEGKIRLLCEDCQNERVVFRHSHMLERCEHRCRACSNARNAKARTGKFKPWNKGKEKPLDQVKTGHIMKSKSGYLEIYLGKQAKAYGRSDNFVFVHRKVMQDAIGRPLSSKEIIHHIDGNKLNNELSNLFLCSSTSEHRDIHSQLEQLSLYLVRCGVITFSQGVYQLADEHQAMCTSVEAFAERYRVSQHVPSL